MKHVALSGEHPKGDLGQGIFFIFFMTVWMLDSFFLRFSTGLAVHVPLSLRLVWTAVILAIGLALVLSGHKVIEMRDQRRLLTTGAFGRMRHPVYLGTILFYLALWGATLSLAALAVLVVIVILYNFIASDIPRSFTCPMKIPADVLLFRLTLTPKHLKFLRKGAGQSDGFFLGHGLFPGFLNSGNLCQGGLSMRHKLIGILALFVFLAAVPFLHCDQKILTILHTNDTHSNLFPLGPNDSLGGIARMSTLIKSLKAKDQNVLTLNAGDVFVGTFEFNKYIGYPELKMMEGLYDAMELGNHEFDLGTDVLTGVLSGFIPKKPAVTLPIICANIDRTASSLAPPQLLALVQPSIIKAIGGLKVGITGVVTTDPQNYSEAVLKILTDPYAAAGTEAAALKAAACDVVICVSHLGLMADELYLSGVKNIDIIIGGHSHDALKAPVSAGGKIIVQAGEFGKFLGELKLKVGTEGVSVADYKLHDVDWKIRKDPHLLLPLAALRVGLVLDPRFGPVLGKFVAQAAFDMEKSWPQGSPYRDTPVGNLVSDAIKWGVKKAGYSVDVALEALGYIGSKIYKGKIVGEDVMRVVPYGYDPTSGLGFKLVVVPLYGAQILGGLAYTLSVVQLTTDMLIQPSGLAYAYDPTKNPSLAWATVNGEPIQDYQLYSVAMNEQVFNVLKGLDPNITKVDTGLFEYNVVRDYLKKLIHVGYVSEGRVIDLSVQ